MNGTLSSLLNLLQGADVAPTTQLVAAVTQAQGAIAPILARWEAIKTKDVTALNEKLKAANLAPLNPAVWRSAKMEVEDADEAFGEDEEDEP
ncbi:MAG: hypothetical protein EXR93_02160 [Gemmatimonadetes bacterium]|nr:hypothetical protein [Gemmatimonadota bacterium]